METDQSSKLATTSIEEGPNWVDLPADILEIIIKKIAVSVVDSIRLRAVCRLWCKASCGILISSPQSQSQSQTTPWLMFDTGTKPKKPKKINNDWWSSLFFSRSRINGDDEEEQDTCSFFSIEDHHKTYRPFKKMMPRNPYYVRGSSRGWLVYFDEKFNTYIFNPCSRVEIPLPTVKKAFSGSIGVYKAILLSDPSRTKDWRVVVSSVGTSGILSSQRLAIYMHGNQNNNNNNSTTAFDPWTEFGHQKYQDITLHNDDKLFALSLTGSGSVEVWDVHETNKLPTIVASFTNTVDLRSLPENIDTIRPGSKFYHLVDSLDDVLIVVEAVVVTRNICQTLEFFVYKLDYSGKKWEKLESLGDRILFLSAFNETSISVSAPNCSRFQKNSIYFEEKLGGKMHVFVYNFENKVSRRVPDQPDDMNTSCWIVPHPTLSAGMEPTTTPTPTPNRLFILFTIYVLCFIRLEANHNSSN